MGSVIMNLCEALKSGKPFNKPLLLERNQWAVSVKTLLVPGTGKRAELVYVNDKDEVLCGVDANDLTDNDFYLKPETVDLDTIIKTQGVNVLSTVLVNLKNKKGKTKLFPVGEVRLNKQGQIILEVEIK